MPSVVIADDSPTLRRILGSVLGRDGYEVIPTEDGVEAVQAVFRHQPDAVVLDVNMPRLSGYVAARLLKDDWRTADIPVIVLTALDAASDRYWAEATGADRYLTKDFQPRQLTDALNELLGGRSGEGRVRPEPLELGADDVLTRVCDLLDRKLFESSVGGEITALATRSRGFEDTVAGLLQVLARFVEYDLAVVLLLEERTAYVAVARPASQRHYEQLLASAASAAATAAEADCAAGDLTVRLTGADGRLGEEEEAEMATFLSMPLRGRGGRVMGVLGLSSASPNAFGEAALATLRLVDSPAAVVLDNARLAEIRTA